MWQKHCLYLIKNIEKYSQIVKYFYNLKYIYIFFNFQHPNSESHFMWKYLWKRAHWFYNVYEFYCYLHCITCCCVLYSDHLGGKPGSRHVLLLATAVIAPEDLRALVGSGADGGRTSGQLVWWVSGTVWPLRLQPSSKWGNCNFATTKHYTPFQIRYFCVLSKSESSSLQ